MGTILSERILVTGASGFVGRRLVGALTEAGQAVRAATRQPTTPADFPGAEAVTLPDLRQPVDWAAALAGIDRVVHLAGIVHADPRAYSADLYHRVNCAATAELAKAAARAGVRRFVYISSIRAQSAATADHALMENDQPHPTEDYGRSKLMAEAAVRAAGVPYTILRPAVIYGPRVASNIASLLRLTATPLPLPFGAFRNRRSLLGIDNLIAAIRFALDSLVAAGETYMVADPDPLTLAEIVAAMRADRRPGLFSLPPRLFEVVLKCLGRVDVWDRIGGTLVVDPAKLIAAGLKPVSDTRTGLAAMARTAPENNS
jgi:nucleoside-diphosphate-sugar epimerase